MNTLLVQSGSYELRILVSKAKKKEKKERKKDKCGFESLLWTIWDYVITAPSLASIKDYL